MPKNHTKVSCDDTNVAAWEMRFEQQMEELRNSAERAHRLYTGPGVPQLIHGTPITPRSMLPHMQGASFCVSYAARHQLEEIIELLGPKSILLLDSGAYSVWKSGRSLGDDWKMAVYRWYESVLTRVDQALGVIPDVIEGSEADNSAIVDECYLVFADAEGRLIPVWHLNESFGYLEHLVEMGWGTIAFGACGPYRTIGSPLFRERIAKAFALIDELVGDGLNGLARPRIHLLRGNSQAQNPHSEPYSTSDSCNLAINHAKRASRYGESFSAFRARLEAAPPYPAPPSATWPRPSYDTAESGRPRKPAPMQFDLLELVPSA